MTGMPDAPITLAEMIAEAERALGMYQQAFPVLIEVQDINEDRAARRIAVMKEIVRYLQREAEEG